VRRLRPTYRNLALTLIATIIIQSACGGSTFAGQLRLVLAASGPLINSLPLSSTLKTGLVTDFTDMAGDAATLSDCLKTAADKPTKLICVQSFGAEVEAVIARGHFGDANSPRLQQILGLIHGIIASAKIYYGAPSARASSKPVTEATIKAQIDELKRAMEVK